MAQNPTASRACQVDADTRHMKASRNPRRAARPLGEGSGMPAGAHRT
jgi:hypothetical protein